MEARGGSDNQRDHGQWSYERGSANADARTQRV